MSGEIVLGGKLVLVAARVRQATLQAGGYSRRRPGERLVRIVLHHDAALSAAGCMAALDTRKLSTHFIIDNDGTIVQLLDPFVFVAWAQGTQNSGGIAIDLSNACELRFANRYRPPRPVLEQMIQGVHVRWLAPYPCQLEALAELVRVLCAETGIAPVVPRDEEGRPLLCRLIPVPTGVIGHLHCHAQKYDPFGLDWDAFEQAIGG